MLFNEKMKEKVLAGKKTQTRRRSKRQPAEVGKTYKIMQGMRKNSYAGDIEVTRVWRQALGDMSIEDVKAEGFDSRKEFIDYCSELFGYWDSMQVVWVIEFKLVKVIQGT